MNEEQPQISLADQIACVKRELALRKTVYPKRVGIGAMRKAEAEREVARMEAVLSSLQTLMTLEQKTA